MRQKMKMLCVDDDARLRQSLQHQFEAEDFQVDLADDGDVALTMMRGTDYDIVLLDLKMKRMSGLDVLAGMRQMGRHFPVIMLTGIAEVDAALECVRLGARDYISKPYDPEELLHVVIKVLGA